MKKLALLLPLFLFSITKTGGPEQLEAIKKGYKSLENFIINPNRERQEAIIKWADWEKNSEWPVLENSPILELVRKAKQQQVKQEVAQKSQQ